jgi:foldase protein PrsA
MKIIRSWGRHLGGLAILALGAVLLAACGTAPVAAVNGEVITRAELEQSLGRQVGLASRSYGFDISRQPGAAEQIDGFRQQVLEQLIADRLMRQQAKSDGIVVTDQELAARTAQLIAQVGGREQFMESIAASGFHGFGVREAIEREMLVDRLIERHVTGLPTMLTVRRVSHIQVASPQAAAAARQRLVAGESWEKVAGELSQDVRTRATGGDLGFIAQGQMPPRFDAVAFQLPLNQISEPVQSEIGFHIIMATDERTQPPTGPQLEVLREQAFSRFFQGLREKARVERW